MLFKQVFIEISSLIGNIEALSHAGRIHLVEMHWKQLNEFLAEIFRTAGSVFHVSDVSKSECLGIKFVHGLFDCNSKLFPKLSVNDFESLESDQ